jgi:hypothetical protein
MRSMSRRLAVLAVFLGGCAHPAAQREPVAPPAAVAPVPAPPVARPSAPVVQAASTSVDFVRDVRPILESRCKPCHFEGGRMYERRPFDRPETIRDLGERLFTRIKDEPSQAIIRRFLEQGR